MGGFLKAAINEGALKKTRRANGASLEVGRRSSMTTRRVSGRMPLPEDKAWRIWPGKAQTLGSERTFRAAACKEDSADA